MGKICEQSEAEMRHATHKAHFEDALDHMQQLQDLGHPPGLYFDLDSLNPPVVNGKSL